MMHWYDGGMPGWGYAYMIGGTLVFWALVITAVVLLVRYARRGATGTADPGQPAQRPTPEQVLGERFARGEIDGEEYQERVRTLRESAIS